MKTPKSCLAKRMIAVLVSVAVLLGIVLIGGCTDQEETTISTAADLNSSRFTISVDAGSEAAITAEEQFDQAKLVYASSITDAYLSVSQGKTDAFVYGRLFMQYALSNSSINNLYILDDTLDTADIAVGISKSREDLLPRINAFIAESKENGLLDEMYDRWVMKANKEMPQIEAPTDPVETIRIGTSGLVEPITYYDESGALTGYDVELIYRLAAYLNVKVEIEAMSYDALIASLESGRLDAVVADLNVTQERKEIILMSDTYRVTETAVVVRKDMVDELVKARTATLDELNGKTIGLLTGSAYDTAVQERLPDSEILYYSSIADLLMAVQKGMISAYIEERAVADIQMAANSSLYYLDESFLTSSIGFALAQDNTTLAEQINEVIAALKEEGVLDELEKKWTQQGDDLTLELDPAADTSKGTLKVVTSADYAPFSYYQGEQIVGYDIELITRIAERLGYAVEFTNCDFSGVLSSVTTGKYDIAVGGITITEEHKESMLFTDPVYICETVAVLYAPEAKSSSFLSDIQDSFKRTFITENRWKLIVDGLGVTIELALFSLIIGCILGFFFSMVLRSKNRVLRGMGNAVSVVLDGMPILILLMIFYYLIFSKTSLSAVVIGIFAFSLDFANVVAGLLNTGILAVDKGQLEAAESMGYTKWQIFCKITFPQAARQMMGQFNGAVISLVKGTSVVGYITVQDLTKAGDIIRSRTYEAFFPLIVIAVIYFLIAHLFVAIIRHFAMRLDLKRRPRRVKGVIAHD